MSQSFRSLTLVGVVGLLSCGVATPQQGTLVTEGVARASFEVRANGTDLIPVTVIFPSDAEGRPSARSRPALVFIQGGAVSPSRYEWLGIELAKRGFVTALPSHPVALAFFTVDHGEWTRRALVEPEPQSVLDGLVDASKIAVAGHSLGGVVAVKLATQGRFNAAVVQASFPDPADEKRVARLTIPTMSLAAQNDCQAKLADVRSGWLGLPSPSVFVALEGATHFQFTDSEADDLQRGCQPVASLDDAHARMTSAMTAFLGAALSPSVGTGEAALRLIPGATVEAR